MMGKAVRRPVLPFPMSAEEDEVRSSMESNGPPGRNNLLHPDLRIQLPKVHPSEEGASPNDSKWLHRGKVGPVTGVGKPELSHEFGTPASLLLRRTP